MRFRYAMCNEAFESRPFNDVCRNLRGFGYEGIEIAPFTLAAHPLEVDPARRRELREIMTSEGISFVGLHFILVGPTELHITTPDRELREKSWQYVRHLIDLCADLGPGAFMVFGSPKQRAATGGMTAGEARRHFVDGLANLAPHAEERGVTLLAEACPLASTDVIHTLAEAVEAIREIGSPAVRTMFDVHNATDETESHDKLIARHWGFIRHIHVNERDGGVPGTGDYDFVPLFRALDGLGYNGWVSLEMFDFKTDPVAIAKNSIRYLKEQAEMAIQ
ncbi:MAG: sugar phosphate isomerase/epimerase family protein [Bryobacteraceae bacterium]|jgi:sugar phosphate isomerase/epimerase